MTDISLQPEEPERPSWHFMPMQEILDTLGTTEAGLTGSRSAELLLFHGPNSLRQAPPPSLFSIFLRQFKESMVFILLAAVIVSIWLGEYADALIIGIIIIANAALGFFQEYKAERSMEALKKMTVSNAKVRREGSVSSIPALDLVPGDVIVFEAGDVVAADGRLLAAHNLRIQEALLTGESLPSEKSSAVIPAGDSPLGDRVNMVFSGTMITDGSGSAVVTSTGMNTEMGTIAGMIESVEEEMTPLQVRMAELGRWLAAICIVGAAGISVMAYYRLQSAAEKAAGMAERASGLGAHAGGDALREAFMTGVSLAVAAIPEGLAAVITVCLAFGVRRMALKNAVIRRLPAVETLGNATYICSDKTGTLTRNEMTVVNLWLPGIEIEVEGRGYSAVGGFKTHQGEAWNPSAEPVNGWGSASDMGLGTGLFLAAALACNAELEGEANDRKVIGDPTEGALLVLAEKAGFSRKVLQSSSRKIWEGPFDSDRKRMSVLVEPAEPAIPTSVEGTCPIQGPMILVKGAPDTILTVCDRLLTIGGGIVSLGKAARDEILAANEVMARKALRVIGFAFRHSDGSRVPADVDEAERDLIFTGLAGLIDPPREEVRISIDACHTAGIRPVMITGDHKLTAMAIAMNLGILRKGERAVSGSELDKLSEADLLREAPRISVYARVSPAHKLRIVHTLQNLGQIVAMTGDGVNDVPALKEADIGIAMGITGTEVTKGAADMVLLDDNFSTIVEAVREGRIIYDNILKFIRFLLASNFGEVVAMFLAILAGIAWPEFPMPLALVQILWVNLLTDGVPAIALGLDSGDPDIMERPPRKPGESVFSDGLLIEIAFRGLQIGLGTLAAFVAVLWAEGFWAQGVQLSGSAAQAVVIKARSTAFTALVLFQMFYVFRCRTRGGTLAAANPLGNTYLCASVAISVGLQFAVLYIPVLQGLFKTTDLGSARFVSYWLLIIPLAMTAIIPLPFFEKRHHGQTRPLSEMAGTSKEALSVATASEKTP